MSEFRITTSGTPTTVVFRDLGRALEHPVVAHNFYQEFTPAEVSESADVQAAIDSGAITVTDENGTPITTTACCLNGPALHFLLPFLNSGPSYESTNNTSWYYLSSQVWNRGAIKVGFTATLWAYVIEGSGDVGRVRIYDLANGSVGFVTWGNTGNAWVWVSADITAGLAATGTLELEAQMRRDSGAGYVNVSHVIVEIRGT